MHRLYNTFWFHYFEFLISLFRVGKLFQSEMKNDHDTTGWERVAWSYCLFSGQAYTGESKDKFRKYYLYGSELLDKTYYRHKNYHAIQIMNET